MKWPKAVVLRPNPSHDDSEWKFPVPAEYLSPELRRQRMLKITLTGDAITLSTDKISSNRVIHADDPAKFILLGLDRSFRFPDHPPRSRVEYLNRMFKAGVFLNGVQYRFYHHSNSQLRGRSCFLRQAATDQELDHLIYAMGDFGRINNVAKRAKRIGLLFSSAEIDFQLDPTHIEDIPDIEFGGEVFSDGCGLISEALAVRIAKAKGLVFRGTRYTPVVIQIRYLGYKGVLMIHPDLDSRNRQREVGTPPCHAQFRKSMKKFNATSDNSFSVVGYSKPYSFGRLNNDIITLLHSLGVTTEKLLARQQAYFDWIAKAIEFDDDPTPAIDFLSCLEKHQKAEQVLLRDGESSPKLLKEIRSYQLEELSKHHDKETGKYKTRMMIHKSRRLFGVCDPYQVLKEGQVHIRITEGRKGPATPIHGDVLVVRNPCLHPGDCLKLRAVDHPQLSHLVDCVVFASQARKPGNKPAPSMTSGGDLDGDEFFVCWDPDLVPPKISESYDYPPNKEPRPKNVTRADLANHFAAYNSSGVAKVSLLHNKWAISSPLGALCVECQELNVLHSQSVDGAPIKVPDRLQNPPEPTEPFIIDVLRNHEEEFEANFRALPDVDPRDLVDLTADDAQRHVGQLFKGNQSALSEYELFELALRLSRKHKFDLKPYLAQLDVSALTSMQKSIIKTTLDLAKIDYPFIWNSLFQSDILSAEDLRLRGFDSSISLQKLYSSSTSSQATFFEYLQRATQDYTRKLLLLKTDERFSVGIFMRGDIPWEEEPEVTDNVVAVTFMAKSSATPPTHRPCTKGYHLHCSYGRFQLYNNNIGDTFVFIGRSPSEHQSDVVMSIALGKFSASVQRQLGRLNRAPLKDIELHVVSNHDRVAQQLFDLWYSHVPTEEYIPRFVRRGTPYRANDIRDVNWSPPAPNSEEFQGEELEQARKQWLQEIQTLELIETIIYPYPEDMKLPPNRSRRHHSEHSIHRRLLGASLEIRDTIMHFTLEYHAEEESFLVFHDTISGEPFPTDFVTKWLERYPQLSFALLRRFAPTDDLCLDEPIIHLATNIIRAIVRSANETRIAALVALEKLAATIGRMSTRDYFNILMLVALSVRSHNLAREVLLVLHESRLNQRPQPLSPSDRYMHKHSLNIVVDRAEEAGDECPCNDDGQPRKQRTPPAQVKLSFVDSNHTLVKAAIRLDARTNARLHSHVRLKATSKAENKWLTLPVLDGLVAQMNRGEMVIELKQPAPPELERMDWVIYDAGGTSTANAEMDALSKLIIEGYTCCAFYHLITGDTPMHAPSTDSGIEPPPTGESHKDQDEGLIDEEDEGSDDGNNFEEPSEIVLPNAAQLGLNPSQFQAVASWSAPLSLIWGPPGTGKTTVVVQILRSIILTFGAKVPAILMTASTHNAVDNVLERFLVINAAESLLPEDRILRVATDQSRVGTALLPYTIDDRVGGDVNQNRKRMKEAARRVKQARLVFSTCAGAGLGILRKFRFSIVIIDEASQITEACALVPLVKGAKKAIMVGDHVQLRPTVRKMGKVLESDISLLERLYTGEDVEGIQKTMLDVQYRSPQVLNAFPSQEFYNDKLQTAEQNEGKLTLIENLLFPWPKKNGAIAPAVFVPCSVEEDQGGGRSKSNEGQVEVVRRVVQLLAADPEKPPLVKPLDITVLSPYKGQIQKLRHRLSSSVPVSTVDAFQGRESDIIIFSTVRCNAHRESSIDAIGFLDDPRRLNVMWTRARLALIIVGDRSTLSENSPLWKRALNACQEVSVEVED